MKIWRNEPYEPHIQGIQAAAHRPWRPGSAKCLSMPMSMSTPVPGPSSGATGQKKRRRPAHRSTAPRHGDGFDDEDHLRGRSWKIMEDLAVWWFCMILWWGDPLQSRLWKWWFRFSLCIWFVVVVSMSFEHLQPWLLAKGWFSQPRNQNAWDQRLPLSHALMTELHVIRDETGIKCPSSWSVCKACDHRLHSCHWRWGFTVV